MISNSRNEDQEEAPPLLSPEPATEENSDKDSYVCSECSSQIEIESIDFKKIEITFECKSDINNHSKKTLSIEDYIDLMEANTYRNSNCSICGKNQKKDYDLPIFDFCPTCNKIFCEKCKINHEHILIKNNEKFVRCLIHPNKKNDSYCNDCKMHLCVLCRKSKKHVGHNKDAIDEIEPTDEEKDDVNKYLTSLKKERDTLEDNKRKELEKMESDLEKDKKKIIYNYKKDKILSEKKLKKDIKIMEYKLKEDVKNLQIKFINDLKKVKINYSNSLRLLKDNQKIYSKNIEKNKNNKIVKVENEFKNKKISFLNEFNRNKKGLESVIDIVEIVKTSYEKYDKNIYYCKNFSTMSKNTKGIKKNKQIENNQRNINNNTSSDILIKENELLKEELNKYKNRESMSENKEPLNKNQINDNIYKKQKKEKKINEDKKEKKINEDKKENKINEDKKENKINEDKKENKINENKKENKINEPQNVINQNDKKILLKENKNNNIKYPKKCKNITKEAFCNYHLSKPFCVFKSVLIYCTKKRLIICYDLTNYNKLDEKRDAHAASISNIRYFNDKNKGRDIVITISSSNSQINLWNWNGKRLENLKKLQNIYNKGFIYSAVFFNINNKDFIITSNCFKEISNKCESMKLYNIQNSEVSEIKGSNENTYFIDTFSNDEVFHIITANYGKIKSYDCKKNCLYQTYNSDDDCEHYKFIIIENQNILKLIDLAKVENLRIWNYNSGEMINNIVVGNKLLLYDMCEWNNDSIFIACENKKIILINIDTNNKIGELECNDDKEKEICCVKSVNRLNNEKDLYSQCVAGQVKTWTN